MPGERLPLREWPVGLLAPFPLPPVAVARPGELRAVKPPPEEPKKEPAGLPAGFHRQSHPGAARPPGVPALRRPGAAWGRLPEGVNSPPAAGSRVESPLPEAAAPLVEVPRRTALLAAEPARIPACVSGDRDRKNGS